jgi:hypothetical protein
MTDQTTITTKLNTYAEFLVQADLLAMNKRKLLEEVAIPDEVLQAQDEANKARQAADSELWKRQRIQNDQKTALLSERVKPNLPIEYVEAMEAYRLAGVEIEKRFDEEMQADQKMIAEKKAKIDTDLQAAVADVYKQVQERKQAIEAEFSDKEQAVNKNAETLFNDIKQDVKVLKSTVKGDFYQAQYVKGRITWITDKMDGIFFTLHDIQRDLECYVVLNQELKHVWLAVTDVIADFTAARKEGDPSVTIKRN